MIFKKQEKQETTATTATESTSASIATLIDKLDELIALQTATLDAVRLSSVVALNCDDSSEPRRRVPTPFELERMTTEEQARTADALAGRPSSTATGAVVIGGAIMTRADEAQELRY